MEQANRSAHQVSAAASTMLAARPQAPGKSVNDAAKKCVSMQIHPASHRRVIVVPPGRDTVTNA